MNTPTDIAELRRLHEAATKGEWVAPDSGDDCLYASAEMMGPRRPIAHFVRLPNRKFIAAAHNALPALLDELEAAREALSQIYWKSIKLGEDRGDSTVNHIAADALKGDTSPLHARDRRMKAIGAAEEVELLIGNWRNMRLEDYLPKRAAQLRQEAGE